MKVIGLTGGIGSGKSTASRFLAELGAVVIDADKIGHEVFQPGTEAWRAVVTAFGKHILTPNGDIDRAKLGKLVFGNPESLARLNQIMHPRIAEKITAKIAEYRNQGVAVAVIEAPLLIEAGWPSVVDEIWITVAPESTVLRRLHKRGGLSEAESSTRIRSQLSSEERVKHANVVIDTDCRLDELKARVGKLWERLQVKITPSHSGDLI